MKCKAIECPRSAEKKEFCNMHYRRWRKHGDPEIGAKPPARLKSERAREWRQRNKGTTRVCTKCATPYIVTSHYALCAACYRAFKRKWVKENQEHENLRRKACRARNLNSYRLVGRRSMAKRLAEDPEKINSIRKIWRAANPEKMRIMDAKKKAKRRNAPIGEFNLNDWFQLLKIWGHKCAYCGHHDLLLTKDHMIPLVRGGSHDVSNIVPACKRCNSSKSARTVEEYYQWLNTVKPNLYTKLSGTYQS
jgi:5-methylcytosine-specific restriction endonuclease McrA